MGTTRPARTAEYPLVSELILQSDCGMLTALFGERVRELLTFLQARTGNPYSARHTLVIEQGADRAAAGTIVGAAVGSLVSRARAGNLRTAGQLARWYGPRFISRLPRLIRAGRAVDSLAGDDFYLSHIAVLPTNRGQGAGARLLRAVEERARTLGARRLVLDVEEGNGRARAFYDRVGYAELSTVRIDLGRHGVFDFRRLWRDLAAGA